MAGARHVFLGLAMGVAMLAPAAANAATFQTLYRFTGPDGKFPFGLAFDKKGNLFGTTPFGGANTVGTGCNLSDRKHTGCGTVFKLTPPAAANGIWTETIYSFTGSPNGARPDASASPLALGANGALYGTSPFGGFANNTTCKGGCGTVFELDPATLALTTIHTFTAAPIPAAPWSGVIFGTKGELYGTTQGGNNGNNKGPVNTVFKLTPPAQGKAAWTYATLHTFPQIPSGLVVDKKGNLYGTTRDSGPACISSNGCGTAFKFNPATGTLTKLYTFTDREPHGLKIHYRANGTFVLYGTTRNGADTVFALDPTTRKLTTLHTFTGGAVGGQLVFDKNGALYGTALEGGNFTGCSAGCGTVFKLTPPAWTFTKLHTFTGRADGGGPFGLVLDNKGMLYGTTVVGGKNNACPDNSGYLDFPENPPPGCGVVFKLIP